MTTRADQDPSILRQESPTAPDATSFILNYVSSRSASPEELLAEAIRENNQLRDMLAKSEAKVALLEARLAGWQTLFEQMKERIFCLERGFQRHVPDNPDATTPQLDLGLSPTDLIAQSERMASQDSEESAPPSEAANAEDAENASESAPDAGEQPEAPAPRRRDAHGRRKSGTIVERLVITAHPSEVVESGLENFRIIGTDRSSTFFYRRAGLVEVVRETPRLVPTNNDSEMSATDLAVDAVNRPELLEHLLLEVPPQSDFLNNPYRDGAIVRFFPNETNVDESPILSADAPEVPFRRCLADASLLAYLVVNKMDLHLPYYRQERIFRRLGVPISRTNMVRWHYEAGGIAVRIADAMWNDALTRSWIATDATGTAIFEKEQYRAAHIFALVAEGDSILFRYQPKYDSATMESMFGGYTGVIVADASKNHDKLFGPGKATEAGCWAHLRRYLTKASCNGFKKECARPIAWIKELFAVEKANASCSADERLAARTLLSNPIVERFFAWVDDLDARYATKDSLRRAVTYAKNQRGALSEFLQNGKIPIHNNACERSLRRVVKGRRNWLFMATDEHARRSCGLYSLVASCELHGLDPEFYLQEILTVAPSWPTSQLLELSPKYWVQTRIRLIRDGRLKYIDVGKALRRSDHLNS